MFKWFKRTKSNHGNVDVTIWPEDHVTRGRIARLVRGAITDNSLLRETAKPNCALVLDVRGDVSFRWVSESDNVDDVVGFVLIGELAAYRELLQACLQEVKAETFDLAFINGPGSLLIDRVAIEALATIKKDCD